MWIEWIASIFQALLGANPISCLHLENRLGSYRDKVLILAPSPPHQHLGAKLETYHSEPLISLCGTDLDEHLLSTGD